MDAVSSSLVQTAGSLSGTQIAWEGAAKGGMNSPAFLLKSGTWQEFPIFDTSIQQILEVLIKAVRQEKKKTHTHKLEKK